ncbi:MAG TPA: glycine cleavage system protein GcvH [Candidatus Aminicenantes bacterium]|nr:glycine cleavage system protein GcvH [Candidatus Aminicenantes bacterium]
MSADALKFTKDHEWVRLEGDIAVMGISEHAQHELGDVVYVELPAVGDSIKRGDALANVESVKAVSDVYAPVSGEIVAVNENLEDHPEQINKDAEGGGWIAKIKISDAAELDELMPAEDYRKMIS